MYIHTYFSHMSQTLSRLHIFLLTFPFPFLAKYNRLILFQVGRGDVGQIEPESQRQRVYSSWRHSRALSHVPGSIYSCSTERNSLLSCFIFFSVSVLGSPLLFFLRPIFRYLVVLILEILFLSLTLLI